MLIRDVMTLNPEVVTPATSLPVAVEIMRRHRVRHLPVVENGELKGVVTERALREMPPILGSAPPALWDIAYRLAGTSVEAVMSMPVRTIEADAPVEQAAAVMRQHEVGCLPVVDQGRLVGIVTESDIFQHFVRILTGDAGFLKLVAGAMPDAPHAVRLLSEVPHLRSIVVSEGHAEITVLFGPVSHEAEARKLVEAVQGLGLKVRSWHFSPPVALLAGV